MHSPYHPVYMLLSTQFLFYFHHPPYLHPSLFTSLLLFLLYLPPTLSSSLSTSIPQCLPTLLSPYQSSCLILYPPRSHSTSIYTSLRLYLTTSLSSPVSTFFFPLRSLFPFSCDYVPLLSYFSFLVSTSTALSSSLITFLPQHLSALLFRSISSCPVVYLSRSLSTSLFTSFRLYLTSNFFPVSTLLLPPSPPFSLPLHLCTAALLNLYLPFYQITSLSFLLTNFLHQ